MNMMVEEAEAVLERNYICCKGTLVYDLHERSCFSVEHFWELYDCIITLAEEIPGDEKELETGGKIFTVCGWVLKEMIYHFDQNDLSALENFPENYNDYIERLDDAADAYFRGGDVDEPLYQMQRPEGLINDGG